MHSFKSILVTEEFLLFFFKCKTRIFYGVFSSEMRGVSNSMFHSKKYLNYWSARFTCML